MNSLLIIISLILTSMCFAQNDFKNITLYNETVQLSVPPTWKKKEHAMLFATYEIKYDIAIKDPNSNARVEFFVQDSLHNPLSPITDSLVNNKRLRLLSDPDLKIRIEDYGVKTISDTKVGFIKYTELYENVRSYCVAMFFFDKRNIYYKLNIVGRSKDAKIFRPLAEKIFGSFQIIR